MVQMNKQFDARQVDPSDNFEAIESGWYTAQLQTSESLKTNAGDGSYLKLMFKILQGKYKGRMVFTNLNLDNPNPVAVEIAERNLSAICHATGVFLLENTEQLHGKPLEIKVKYIPAKGKYDASNDVSGYRPLEKMPDFASAEKKSEPASQTAQQETEQPDPPEQDGPPPSDDDIPAWMR
jgi:hypothetical protein